jgi:hypothetical protein
VTSVPFWISYLALCLLALYALAVKWNQAGGNRLFTIGLKRMWHTRSSHAHS